MKTNNYLLPGIKAIGWLRSDALPTRIDLKGICGQIVKIINRINYVDFFDEPKCNCKREKNAGNYTETATLQFQCGEKLPEDIKLSFLVTDVFNKSYIIGSKEAPMAEVAVELKKGVPGSESASYNYEVKHVALKTLIPCILL